MSGRSGRVVARSTRLASHNGCLFALSAVQAEIVDRAMRQNGVCSVDWQLLRNTRVLVNLGLGTLQDDCLEDGSCWIFQIAEGVSLR